MGADVSVPAGRTPLLSNAFRSRMHGTKSSQPPVSWSNAWLLFHQESQRSAWNTDMLDLDMLVDIIPVNIAPRTKMLAAALVEGVCGHVRSDCLSDAFVRHPPSCLWLVCATLAHISYARSDEDAVAVAEDALVDATQELVKQVISKLEWSQAVACADLTLAALAAHSSSVLVIQTDLMASLDSNSPLVWSTLEKVWVQHPHLERAFLETTCLVRGAVAPGKEVATTTTMPIDSIMQDLELFCRGDGSIEPIDDVVMRLRKVNFFALLHTMAAGSSKRISEQDFLLQCLPALQSGIKVRHKDVWDDKAWLDETKHYPRNPLIMLTYVMYRLNRWLASSPLFESLVETCLAWPDSWHEFELVTSDWFRHTKRRVYGTEPEMLSKMHAFLQYFLSYTATTNGEQYVGENLSPRLLALQKTRRNIRVEAEDVYRGMWKSRLKEHEHMQIVAVSETSKQQQRAVARQMAKWYGNWLSLIEHTQQPTYEQNRRPLRLGQLPLQESLHVMLDACRANLIERQRRPGVEASRKSGSSTEEMEALVRLLATTNACSAHESVLDKRHPLLPVWCWLMASMAFEFEFDWLDQEADHDDLARRVFDLATEPSTRDLCRAAQQFWIIHGQNHVRSIDNTAVWQPNESQVSFRVVTVLLRIAGKSVNHWPTSMCLCTSYAGRRARAPRRPVGMCLRGEETGVCSIDIAWLTQHMRMLEEFWLTATSSARMANASVRELTLEQSVGVKRLENLNFWSLYHRLCGGDSVFAGDNTREASSSSSSYLDPLSLLQAQDLFASVPHTLRLERGMTEPQEQLWDDKRWLEMTQLMSRTHHNLDESSAPVSLTRPNMLVLFVYLLFRASLTSAATLVNPRLLNSLALADDMALLLYQVEQQQHITKYAGWNAAWFLEQVQLIAPQQLPQPVISTSFYAQLSELVRARWTILRHQLMSDSMTRLQQH